MHIFIYIGNINDIQGVFVRQIPKDLMHKTIMDYSGKIVTCSIALIDAQGNRILEGYKIYIYSYIYMYIYLYL
jgi:GTP-sensing pleiotropic transcriptional regulator CodY